MFRRAIILVSVASAFGPSALALAHSHWSVPTSRSQDDFLMRAPCGGVPRTKAPTEFEAGAIVDAQWVITQNHGNSFRIAFSPADDLGFDDNVIGTIPDREGVSQITQAVPLPDCTCEACTLQLLQYSTTGKAGYFSCADIRLLAPRGRTVPSCSESDESADESGSDDSGADAADGAGTTTETQDAGHSDGATGPGTAGTNTISSSSDSATETAAGEPASVAGCACASSIAPRSLLELWWFAPILCWRARPARPTR